MVPAENSNDIEKYKEDIDDQSLNEYPFKSPLFNGYMEIER